MCLSVSVCVCLCLCVCPCLFRVRVVPVSVCKHTRIHIHVPSLARTAIVCKGFCPQTKSFTCVYTYMCFHARDSDCLGTKSFTKVIIFFCLFTVLSNLCPLLCIVFCGKKNCNCQVVDFHPYGAFFASGSLDTNIKVWDIRRKACIQVFCFCGHQYQRQACFFLFFFSGHQY